MPLDLSPPADVAERVAALTGIDRTMLVEAGAGTGKTSIMAGRVVMLMAAGVPPGEIVAISFTELAASELRERIVRFVGAVLGGRIPPDLLPAFAEGQPTPEQRRNLETASGDLDRLCCMTIHGFCQTLLTPYPVEANIDPGAAVIDKAEADLLFEDICKDWLRERLSGPPSEDDAFVALFLADERETRRLLALCAGHMRSNPGMTVPRCDLVADEIGRLRQAVEAFRAFLRAKCQSCCPEKVAQIVKAAEEQLVGAPDPTEPSFLTWAIRLAVPGACATKDDTFNSERSVCAKSHWKDAATGKMPKGASDLLQAEAVTHYHALRDAHDGLRSAACGYALHIIGQEAVSILLRYAEAKRSAAALDFDDLIDSTRRLLAERPDVRQALQGRFQALLVDEFQDTDPAQMEIFWRLCGNPPQDAPDLPWQDWRLRPGRLFLVGDPRQAIYRFRGGDLATYLRAAGILERDPAAGIVRITRNFRSRACILGTVNGWFETVFTGLDGQAAFVALSSDAPDPLTRPGVARLDFAPEQRDSDRPVRDIEAELVARACRRLVGNLMVRRADGSVGPCEPSDIALLTPGGTDLWRYERALEDAELAVAPQAGKGFFRRQEVQDLIALTRALADGRDRLALGALLRGPLVGIPDEVLLDAVEAQRINPGDTPRLHLHMDVSLIPDPVMREAMERLQDLFQVRRGMTPHMLLSRAVDLMKVRPILRQRGGRVAERALANVDLFLEMARAYDLRGLKAFADAMRAQWEEAQRSLDARPDMDRQSVSLMTMHSAKGLEWPVVIIVNTAGKIHDPIEVATDRATGLFYAKAFRRLPVGCEQAMTEEDRQLSLQRERLWWVATTRARDLLLMPDPAQRLSKPAWIKAVSFPLDGVEPFDQDRFPALDIEAPPVPPNRQDLATFTAEGDRIAAAIPAIERRSPSRHEGMADGKEDGADPSDVQTPVPEATDNRVPAEEIAGAGAVRGLVLHKLFEEVLNGTLADTMEALAARATVLLDQLGPDPNKMPSPNQMAKEVRWALTLPEIAAVRPILRAEWPVTVSTVGQDGSETIMSGIADAVAVEGTETPSLVVDWKSDVNATEAVKAHYRRQLRLYLSAVGAPRGLLVFLSARKCEEVRS